VSARKLLQFRLLDFGFFEDGDLGISILPHGEKVLVGGARFCGVSLQGVSACETELGKRERGSAGEKIATIGNLTKLEGRICAVFFAEIGEAARIGNQGGSSAGPDAQLDAACGFKKAYGFVSLAIAHDDDGENHRLADEIHQSVAGILLDEGLDGLSWFGGLAAIGQRGGRRLDVETAWELLQGSKRESLGGRAIGGDAGGVTGETGNECGKFDIPEFERDGLRILKCPCPGAIRLEGLQRRGGGLVERCGELLDRGQRFTELLADLRGGAVHALQNLFLALDFDLFGGDGIAGLAVNGL